MKLQAKKAYGGYRPKAFEKHSGDEQTKDSCTSS